MMMKRQGMRANGRSAFGDQMAVARWNCVVGSELVMHVLAFRGREQAKGLGGWRL